MGKNVIYLTILKVLNIVIPLICMPYVSRVLGADNIGIYSYTSSLAAYFALVAGLGTMSYGSREISRHRDDIYVRSKLFWEIEILTIVTTFICLLVWFVFVIFSGEYHTYYMILSVNILAVLFDISWLFYGLEQFKYLAFRIIFVKIISIFSIFIFVNDKSNLYIYFVIIVVTQILTNVISWFGVKNYIKRIKLSELNIKKHIKQTFVYFIPSMATSVYTILDKSFLGAIRKNNYESGCYEQAEQIISIAKGAAFSALNVVVGVRNSYLHEKNEINKLKANISSSLDYVLLLSVGFIFGIIGVASNFINIYLGAGYELAVDLLMILSPTIILIGISDCLGSQYYIPYGKRRISARFIVIGAFVNVIFNAFMIPLWGAVGASVATIIAELTITMLYTLNAREVFPFKTVIISLAKKIIAGFVMLGGITLISHLFTLYYINALLELLIEVVAGIFIYVIMLAILKDNGLNKIIYTLLKKHN